MGAPLIFIWREPDWLAEVRPANLPERTSLRPQLVACSPVRAAFSPVSCLQPGRSSGLERLSCGLQRRAPQGHRQASLERTSGSVELARSGRKCQVCLLRAPSTLLLSLQFQLQTSSISILVLSSPPTRTQTGTETQSQTQSKTPKVSPGRPLVVCGRAKRPRAAAQLWSSSSPAQSAATSLPRDESKV